MPEEAGPTEDDVATRRPYEPRGWLDAAASAQGGSGRPGPASVERRVELFAVGWFALVVAADLVFRDVILVGLLNLSTLLVSAVSSLRRTAMFAVASVVVAALCPLWDTGQTTSTEVVRVVNTALLGAVALVLVLLRQRRERHVLHIVAAAEAAQRAVLPTLPKQAGQVGVAARYHSAAEEAMVGGDVFDMYYNETGTVIALVGDVAGHGLASVEEGARLIRAFRQYAPTSQTLDQLAALMNAYITPFLASDIFVTAVLADVSSPDHVRLASCGHHAPVLVSRTGMLQPAVVHGPPLGLGAPTEVVTTPWSPGDRLLLFTDGLPEARDRSGRFLPLELIEPAMRAGSPDEAVDKVIAVLEGYVADGRLQDDVCLMVLENRGHVGTDQPAAPPEPEPG